MKEKTPILLNNLTVLLLVYGIFATIRLRKLENRVGILEQQLAHIFDPKILKISSAP